MHTGSRLNSQNSQNEVLLSGEIQSVEGQTDNKLICFKDWNRHEIESVVHIARLESFHPILETHVCNGSK